MRAEQVFLVVQVEMPELPLLGGEREHPRQRVHHAAVGRKIHMVPALVTTAATAATATAATGIGIAICIVAKR